MVLPYSYLLPPAVVIATSILFSTRPKKLRLQEAKPPRMKKFVICLHMLFFANLALAQAVPYNVVFDLTSKDVADHHSVIRWISAISKERPDAKLELVLYGGALDMVQPAKSSVADDLKTILKNPNVQVKVCAAAMKRWQIDSTQLQPGVGIVPDGIYEIITRQKEGWGYIKVAH